MDGIKLFLLLINRVYGKLGIPSKMNNWKNICLLYLIGFSILFLQVPSFSERITIRYLTPETSYQQILLLKKIISEFEKLHPNIHVQLEATTEARRIFLTDMAAGTPPDVMYTTSDLLAQLVDKNAVIPLTEFIIRDQVDLSIFYPSLVQYLTFQNELYGYPIHYSTPVIFYNKQLFDKYKIPYPDESWTWHIFQSVAEKLTLDLNNDGRTDIYGCLTPDFGFVIHTYGGKLFNEDGSRCVINSPEALQAVNWANSLIGKQSPTAAQMMDTNDMQLFANGRLAMFIGRTWQLPQLIETMGDIPWDIAALPKMKKRFYAIAIGSHCIARGIKNPEAAWEFVKFYSSMKGQSLLGVQKNCVPALIPLSQNTVHFLNAPPQNIRLFLDSITDSGRMIPDYPWSSEFISKIWLPSTEKIRSRILAPEKGLALIESEANQLIFKYQKDKQEKLEHPSSGNPTTFLFYFMITLIILGFLTILFIARSNRKYWEGYLFISPWLFGFTIFILGPVLASLFLSFNRYDMLTSPRWIGLNNFKELFLDPLFQRSLKNTLYYASFTIPLQLIFSLILATLLNNRIKGMYTFRAIYYLPAITSGVAISLLWRWLFNPELGLINALLKFIGITGPDWLASPHWAMPAIIIMSVWGGLGAPMLIYLAGLQGIPQQLYEAANLDGAGRWQSFRNVTVPMLSPAIFFNLIMAIIHSFQVFTTIFVMSSNQPDSIEPGGPVNSTLVYVLYLYRFGFRYLEMGKACAMAWILFLLILGLTLLNIRLSKKWVHYEQT